MLLSVIIPVYNNPSLALRCVESLCAGNDDVEILLVDDGSDGASAYEVDTMADNCALNCRESVKAIHVEHRGAAAARNSGVDHVCGRFVWFVDADDTVFSPMMRPLCDTLRSLPVATDLLHLGDMLDAKCNKHVGNSKIEDAVRLQCGELFRPHSSALDHTTYVFRRELLTNHLSVRYPEDMHLLEDSVFVLKALSCAAVVYENRSLRIYRRHCDGSSQTSGRWSETQSRNYVNDICSFFGEMNSFFAQHAGCDPDGRFFARYRYVYKRVLAVKGVEWKYIMQFRNSVKRSGDPSSVWDWMLEWKWIHRSLALMCRFLRK